MSSSMRLAMVSAAGSRAGGIGVGRDLGVRAVACLEGFPAIFSPIWTACSPHRRNLQHSKPRKVFNSEDNIDNSIVNNFSWSYHSKKRRTMTCIANAGGNGMNKDRRDS